MSCPQCFERAKKVKPNLWFCKGCHVFLFQKEGTKNFLVIKKALLDKKTIASKAPLFIDFVGKHVQVECVHDVVVEGKFLNIETRENGALSNMIIQTHNPNKKANILIRGNQIIAIKMVK